MREKGSTRKSRPRSHQIETEQRVAFEALLADAGWVYRQLNNPDYGIDGQVELFDKGRKTGLSFYVQLKATDSARTKRPRRLRLKKEDFEYWLSKTEPVMLVYWLAQEQRMAWIWVPRMRIFADSPLDPLFTFGIAKLLDWTDDTTHLIVEELEAERSVRGSLKLPVSVRVRIAPPLSLAARSELIAELKRLEGLVPSWLKLVFSGGPAPMVVELTRNLLHVSAGISSSYTTKYINQTTQAAKSIAADVFFMVGLLLVKCGHPVEAANVLAPAVADTGMIGSPWMATQGTSLLVQVGDRASAEVLMRRLVKAAPYAAEIPTTYWHVPFDEAAVSCGLADWALQLQIALVEGLAEKFGASAAPHFVALAGCISGHSADRKLELLARAETIDSAVLKEHSYWRAKAAAHLELGQFAESLEGSREAYRLLPSEGNLWLLMLNLAVHGRIDEGFEVLSAYQGEPFMERRTILLAQATELLFRLGIAFQSDGPVSAVRELEATVALSDRDELVLHRIGCRMMMIAISPTMPGTLINLINDAVSVQLNALSELAIDLMAEVHGRSFPIYMRDFLAKHYPDLPPDAFAGLVESWSMKVEQIETGGEWPRETSFQMDDGRRITVRYDEEAGEWTREEG